MRVLGLGLATALALSTPTLAQTWQPMPNGWNGDWHRTPGVSRTGFRTVLLADGSAVRCLWCRRIGSGSLAAPFSIIPSQTGAALPVAGVIHSRLVLSPSSSGFIPPCEISYRGVKLPRVPAALGAILPAVRGRFAAGGGQFFAPGLPMFARHEYRTGEHDKRAVRAVVRWWRGKLKPQALG